MDTFFLKMLLALTLVINFSTATASNPVVTLSHGGQLRGLTAPFGTSMVDAFIGVRYAEPPVGNLRFKKPLEAQGWSGIRGANRTGSMCFQGTLDGRTVGSEDCLYLNIYKPAQSPSYGSDQIPVMVWIHGGGYNSGSGNGYPGAPLSANGDVIVITINYRLGVFGFLADEQGNGNFGLWDQRAALQWIQNNIGVFGGDPDKVTIFGESAGAHSVSALMMSQRTDGLFIRGIQESGSLFQPLGWYVSEKDQRMKRNGIRANTNCSPSTANIFSCFTSLTSEQAFVASLATTNPGTPSWAPIADNDFFSSNISQEDYSPSLKYDVMAGFNGQEGALFLRLKSLQYPDLNVTNGVGQEMAERILSDECSSSVAPTSPAMCQYLLETLYRMEHSRNDRERAIKLSYIIGEINFNADIHRQLEEASKGNHSTYAYYYTQLLPSPLISIGLQTPDWFRRSADHGDELPLVFGAPALERETNNVWLDIIASDPEVSSYFDGTYPQDTADFSDIIMTMWTNFAKSGNPNQPNKLPRGVPVWPQYSKDYDIFMQLHRRNMRLVRTPHKSRLEAVRRNLLSATRLQYLAENQQCV